MNYKDLEKYAGIFLVLPGNNKHKQQSEVLKCLQAQNSVQCAKKTSTCQDTKTHPSKIFVNPATNITPT